MIERPILFSAPMIRAILAGNKTQTRRALRVQPNEHHWQFIPGYELKRSKIVTIKDRCAVKFNHTIPQNPQWDTALDWLLCPYGKPGDQLWVREAFACTDAHEPAYDGSIEYRADNKVLAVSAAELFDVPHDCDPRPFAGPWKPGIHMFRWQSRLQLEVTDVRVERLTGISTKDCWAEGIPSSPDVDPLHEYRDLWESINGADSWDADPWVWVIEFRPMTTPPSSATGAAGIAEPNSNALDSFCPLEAETLRSSQ